MDLKAQLRDLLDCYVAAYRSGDASGKDVVVL